LDLLSLQTPLGTVTLGWGPDGKLSVVRLNQGEVPKASQVPATILELEKALRRYFDEGVPLPAIRWEELDRSGWTPFQEQVYRAIGSIPHGETRTYKWVAARVGKLAATRAVGQALRNNPLPIVIPCHRVVAVGSLGGFMGVLDPSQPELKLKTRLIGLEESYVSPVFDFLAGTAARFGSCSELLLGSA
jgi:methylated-DNA-[protein]-cysteine S-methyltransferase